MCWSKDDKPQYISSGYYIYHKIILKTLALFTILWYTRTR